ncbi:MAG: site-specific integrase [Gammaproteobacteria bacterium]|nr:site-specific integrase [Gammaproteobacteria bacterium]
MGRKHIPGLQKIGAIWQIDKRVNGRRICESTGTGNFEEAERYLIRRLEAIRQAEVYGIRPKRIFRDAAIKYLLENQHKKSIHLDAAGLKIMEPYIGDLFLESVHMGTLQPYIVTRRKEGVKNRTINCGLQIVRRVLNLAASEWMDEFGLTWLASAPKIKLLDQLDSRKPYPLNWDEQERVFSALPEYVREMALFAVNTGCRDQEVCNLRWQWEVGVSISEISSIFIIPGELTKNGEDRLVVLNHVARSVVERQRGKNPEFVFTYKGNSVSRIHNRAWKKAKKEAGINVRVHDLKHTFGRRLRSAGVSFEDRQDLLGHKSARITTHYSAAEILNLWEATNKVCEESRKPTLVLLRTVDGWGHEKVTKGNFLALPHIRGHFNQK